MQFKDMTDRVKYTLGAEEAVWNNEVALIQNWLNEGIVDILVRTRPYTRVINLQLTANTPIHDMSNQILALVDVQIPNLGTSPGSDSPPASGFLKRYSREDITTLQGQGKLGFAYEEPLLWISPIPTTAQAINAYGIFRPTSLVADTDDPQTATLGGLAPEFHPAIVMYALWKGGEYVQHEGSQQGERWRQQYEGQDGTEGQIARIKRILAKRVTPQAARRRNLENDVGVLSDSGSYIGAY